VADEADNLVLVHLREMRAEMTEIRAKLDTHDSRFDAIEKRLGDVYEASIFSVGVAVMTSRKLEQITDRLDNHERRITTLEDA
jgi:hypothetical protein